MLESNNGESTFDLCVWYAGVVRTIVPGKSNGSNKSVLENPISLAHCTDVDGQPNSMLVVESRRGRISLVTTAGQTTTPALLNSVSGGIHWITADPNHGGVYYISAARKSIWRLSGGKLTRVNTKQPVTASREDSDWKCCAVDHTGDTLLAADGTSQLDTIGIGSGEVKTVAGNRRVWNMDGIGQAASLYYPRVVVFSRLPADGVRRIAFVVCGRDIRRFDTQTRTYAFLDFSWN